MDTLLAQYSVSYEIMKRITEDPEYEETPATKAVKAFHDNHQLANPTEPEKFRLFNGVGCLDVFNVCCVEWKDRPAPF